MPDLPPPALPRRARLSASTGGPRALALGGLLALAAAMGIGRFVYTPILPFMTAALGLSQAAAGLIASANFLGYLAGALLAATPWLPGGRRTWLLASLLASALSTGAMAVPATVLPFAALRFLGGLASAYVLVLASALVLDRLATSGQSRWSALHFAGVGAGIAASALLVAGLAAAGVDWRALWLASGLLALLAGLATLWLIPPEPPRPAAPAGAAAGQRAPGLPALLLAYGLFGFGYVITATFITTIVRTTPAISPLEPWIWLAVGLAAMPSVAAWAAVAGRVGSARAYALAALTQALGVAASVLWPSAGGILLAAVLLGGTIMGLTALGLITARRLAGGDGRRVMALTTAAFGLGQTIGPTFAGVLHDQTGSFALPSLVAAAGLVLAAALAWSIPRAA